MIRKSQHLNKRASTQMVLKPKKSQDANLPIIQINRGKFTIKDTSIDQLNNPSQALPESTQRNSQKVNLPTISSNGSSRQEKSSHNKDQNNHHCQKSSTTNQNILIQQLRQQNSLLEQISQKISIQTNQIIQEENTYWAIKYQVQQLEYDITNINKQLEYEDDKALIKFLQKQVLKLNAVLNFKKQTLKRFQQQLYWKKQLNQSNIQYRNQIFKAIKYLRSQMLTKINKSQ